MKWKRKRNEKKNPVNKKILIKTITLWDFDAHCHVGTAIKHPVPDRVKPSFVIFDIRALWGSDPSVRVPGCQKLQMTLNLVWNKMLYSCTHTVGFKELNILTTSGSLTCMLTPGTSEPRPEPSVTTAVNVGGWHWGGLLFGSWMIAVTFVEFDTAVFCVPDMANAYNGP